MPFVHDNRLGNRRRVDDTRIIGQQQPIDEPVSWLQPCRGEADRHCETSVAWSTHLSHKEASDRTGNTPIISMLRWLPQPHRPKRITDPAREGDR